MKLKPKMLTLLHFLQRQELSHQSKNALKFNVKKNIVLAQPLS